MKVEEWKKLLSSIPDDKYTRNLDYTRFEDCRTVDIENEDSIDCFVLLNGEQISPQYADAKKGFAYGIKTNGFGGSPILDKEGDLQFECLHGDVKIVKYKHKKEYRDYPEPI